MGLIASGFFILLGISVPVAVTLGLLSFAGLASFDLPVTAALQTAFESLDSFSLMAVPFYILAGNVMRAGGISQRLVAFANALIGHVRGGLGATSVLTSMFFSTVSGSSSATAAAIGSITIPAMANKGYPKNFAAALVASAGELGSIIPPSLTMIIYALVTNISVTQLFIAGILPGMMIGASLILTCMVIAHLRGFDDITPIRARQWLAGIFKSLKGAGFALCMPVIILGGIYSGTFTPTEAAVVAAVYGLFVSIFVYRQMDMRGVCQVFIQSALTACGLLLIVALASSFAFFLTILQVPHQVSQWIVTTAGSTVMFLLLVNGVLLMVGMFMDALASIIILAPILAPAAMNFGIDPVHFGLIMIVNLATGMVTPPVGVNLFVVCEVAKLRIDQLIAPLSIFLAVLVADILIVTYMPALSLFLIR